MQLFGQNRLLDDVKKQAEFMRSKVGMKKESPEDDLIKKIKKLTPNDRLPRHGTIRRKVLEDEILKIVYCRKDPKDLSDTLLDEDSDDEVCLFNKFLFYIDCI